MATCADIFSYVFFGNELRLCHFLLKKFSGFFGTFGLPVCGWVMQDHPIAS